MSTDSSDDSKSNSQYNFIQISHDKLDSYNDIVKDFELKLDQSYSLGDDSFTIDHGSAYFDFFKRLGKISYFLILHNHYIVGTGCAILRTNADVNTSCWYLCDLKILPSHRGKSLPELLFMKMMIKCVQKSSKGYLVTMDKTDKKANPVIKLFTKIKDTIFQSIKFTTLQIYQVNVKQMLKLHSILEEQWMEISYLSLNGTKDLVLKSTNKPLNLYHLQHGPFASKGVLLTDLPSDADIMFCCTETNKLVSLIRLIGIETSVTATVIHLLNDEFNLNWILTSDI